MKTWLLLVSALLSLQSLTAADDGPLYFSAPEVVVDETTTMLKAKAWKQLARYYDLTGFQVTRAELESGEYFNPTPQGNLPSFVGKRPFPLGFKFSSVEKTSTPDVLRINILLEIDQGGGQIQRARDAITVRKSEHGYQLRPNLH